MGIDIEPDSSDIHSTKAEVNYDSLTGSFAVPSREKPSQIEGKFAFALDEKGIVFIDDSGTAEMLILTVQRTKPELFTPLPDNRLNNGKPLIKMKNRLSPKR